MQTYEKIFENCPKRIKCLKGEMKRAPNGKYKKVNFKMKFTT